MPIVTRGECITRWDGLSGFDGDAIETESVRSDFHRFLNEDVAPLIRGATSSSVLVILESGFLLGRKTIPVTSETTGIEFMNAVFGGFDALETTFDLYEGGFSVEVFTRTGWDGDGIIIEIHHPNFSECIHVMQVVG